VALCSILGSDYRFTVHVSVALPDALIVSGQSVVRPAAVQHAFGILALSGAVLLLVTSTSPAR
jgi:hypothetical protein